MEFFRNNGDDLVLMIMTFWAMGLLSVATIKQQFGPVPLLTVLIIAILCIKFGVPPICLWKGGKIRTAVQELWNAGKESKRKKMKRKKRKRKKMKRK